MQLVELRAPWALAVKFLKAPFPTAGTPAVGVLEIAGHQIVPVGIEMAELWGNDH